MTSQEKGSQHFAPQVVRLSQPQGISIDVSTKGTRTVQTKECPSTLISLDPISISIIVILTIILNVILRSLIRIVLLSVLLSSLSLWYLLSSPIPNETQQFKPGAYPRGAPAAEGLAGHICDEMFSGCI